MADRSHRRRSRRSKWKQEQAEGDPELATGKAFIAWLIQKHIHCPPWGSVNVAYFARECGHLDFFNQARGRRLWRSLLDLVGLKDLDDEAAIELNDPDFFFHLIKLVDQLGIPQRYTVQPDLIRSRLLSESDKK